MRNILCLCFVWQGFCQDQTLLNVSWPIFFFGTSERVLTVSPFCFTNSYIWVQSGQRVTSDNFRNRFETTMGCYFACPIMLHSYRQMAISIAWEHIPLYLSAEDNTIDEAAYHGGPTAHAHYRIVEASAKKGSVM